jgi:RNA polymerase sigma-70 factor (ECF subfamily)
MRADAEALYHANHRGLFRYFCRAVGHAETARDLTQDVFVRVSRSVIPAAPDGALRGWLFQIARNLALDHHRSSQRRPQAQPLTDTGARPASQDTSAQVNEALAALAEVDRDVFLMREVAGLGYDEIATACGLTPDAVRSRIHRTRLQLRERLSREIAVRQASPMRRSGWQGANLSSGSNLLPNIGASEASAGRLAGSDAPTGKRNQ